MIWLVLIGVVCQGDACRVQDVDVVHVPRSTETQMRAACAPSPDCTELRPGVFVSRVARHARPGQT